MLYVALLRGIGPSNPNMHGSKLCSAFEGLGFTEVSSVISSGNVVFSSLSRDAAALEAMIERTLPERLGFTSTTIIRSRNELLALVEKDPFKGKAHGRDAYLIVSFLKDKRAVPGGAIFTAIDMARERPQDVMVRLEKRYDKAITTRTWLTVQRVLARMESATV